MNTEDLRENFLIETLFTADVVSLTLSHFDRYIVGGAMPIKQKIDLPNPDALKAQYFWERREIGMINVGGKGIVTADGKQFEINVPPATQHGSRFRIAGQGLWDVNHPTRGDLFVEVALQVPTSVTDDQLSRLQQLKF